MADEVSSAHADLGRAAGLEVHRELAETAPHPTGDPDRNLAQSSTEVLTVELAVEHLEPMEQGDVTRPRPLSWGGPLRCRCVGLDREPEELPLGSTPERPWNPRVQEPNDRLQHAIRSERVAPMDAEHPTVEAEHHRLVGVSEDAFDFPETQRLQAVGKTILEQKTLPRGPAAPLPRFQSP
jgi:hypothetical protein